MNQEKIYQTICLLASGNRDWTWNNHANHALQTSSEQSFNITYAVLYDVVWNPPNRHTLR